MSNHDNPIQHALQGDDEAVSVGDPLRPQRPRSVADLADVYEADEPYDRRDVGDMTAIVRNSVFGRPEPMASRPEPLRTVSLANREQAVPPTRGRVLLPQTSAVGAVATPTARSTSAVGSLARTVEDGDSKRRRVTLVLASLFGLALVGSVAVTALGLGGTADADIDATEPTVRGTTQTVTTLAVTQPPTTVSPTTVAAPPTTEPTTTQAPTTASTTTSTTEGPTTSEPTTTVAPTTAAPATTARPATTRRPTTTRPPTTQATTAVTLPDVTFSQPTWAGTDSAP